MSGFLFSKSSKSAQLGLDAILLELFNNMLKKLSTSFSDPTKIRIEMESILLVVVDAFNKNKKNYDLGEMANIFAKFVKKVHDESQLKTGALRALCGPGLLLL